MFGVTISSVGNEFEKPVIFNMTESIGWGRIYKRRASFPGTAESRYAEGWVVVPKKSPWGAVIRISRTEMLLSKKGDLETKEVQGEVVVLLRA